MDINALLQAEVDRQNEDRRKWTGRLGDTEVTLYATAISPYDTKRVSKKFPDFETSPSSAAMAYLICLKAVDENGAKVFRPGSSDKILERLPVSFTADIAKALFAEDFDEGDLDLEQLEKNS